MASIKRRCATCRFFQDSGMSGNGWCTHPDRQVSSDVRILVRKAELACRNAWGSDLWEPANAEDAPAARSETPRDIQISSPPMAVAYDDEITSVVNADEHLAARASLDDEVVEQSTISFVDDYDHEQDERRDLLYRNSRSAIERARERHVQRKSAPAPLDDDDVISENDEALASSADSREAPTFEPDDFIEEEAPASTSNVDEYDDALLSEGIRTPSPRARRLRRFRDERPAPKELTAAKIEPEPDDVELELPSSAAPERGRFDSIPEISAEIQLPLLRRASSANTPEPRTQAQGRAEETPDSISYERALKRAHAVNQAARMQDAQQRRLDTSPVAMTTSPASHQMPDLPETTERPAVTPTSATTATTLSGTSAILHPRITPERQQLLASRSPEQEHQAPPTRPRAKRQVKPSPEARQSWWRGGLRSPAEIQDSAVVVEEPEPLDQPYADSTDVDVPAPLTVDVDRVPDMSDAPGFDLHREDDLESFRSRLFGADTPDTIDHQTVEGPARNPISMTRRERRPIAPPARTRHEAPREEFDGAPIVAEEARNPIRQPERRRRENQRPAHHMDDIAVAPESLVLETRDDWREQEPVRQFDVRDLISGDTELLDMAIEIAPDVPKACGTCRSYRPSEQPGRGWCTNSWAFTHRQMVNETDLACDSTIGCWWLPADEEVWLDEFEVASEATPRVDRLIARMEPERRAVGN